MHTPPLPPDAERPANNNLLNDLVALTGLFNPEVIWHEEEILDKLNEQAGQQPPAAAATPPSADSV